MAKKKQGLRTYPITTGAELGKMMLWQGAGKEWVVLVEWAEIGRRYEPVALMLRSCAFDEVGNVIGLGDQPPFAITSELVRAMKVGELLDRMRATQIEWVEHSARSHPEDAKRLERYADRWGGRRGVRVDMETLEKVAEIYRKAWSAGQPVREQIVAEFNVSDSTAAKWIRKCRDAGLLGPATPGKAGEAS